MSFCRFARACMRWLLLALLAGAAQADDASNVQALLARGEMQAALALSEQAMKQPNPGARLRFLYGVTLYELQRDAQALSVFNALAQDYPQLPEPFNNIGALHARAGQWDLAREALETALRNDPSHRMARENLGDVHLQLAILAWRGAQPSGRPDPGLSRKIRFASALAAQSAPLTPSPGVASAGH